MATDDKSPFEIPAAQGKVVAELSGKIINPEEMTELMPEAATKPVNEVFTNMHTKNANTEVRTQAKRMPFKSPFEDSKGMGKMPAPTKAGLDWEKVKKMGSSLYDILEPPSVSKTSY